MNLLQRLQTAISQIFHSSAFSTIITDKTPAAALLGKKGELVSAQTLRGNLPIALTNGLKIQFHLTPTVAHIRGIRLRFGTYCRLNHCHINLLFNHQFFHRFHTQNLPDNQWIDITFIKPYRCVPHQPLTIGLYSEDATPDNHVAVWCSRLFPPFVDCLDLQSCYLPATTHPRVSIVIPVFNKVLYTYNCLLTVQQCDPEVSKEVIIINNASSDETPKLLSQLHGAFTLINNAKNVGFVEACHQGAEAAQGEFILLLNNDTQVMPKWLTSLLKVMDADPQVGAVGSKLIYPNGQLQEAGGIIFNDASGCNYGRYQDPTDFNQSRKVDYCSGACLMIRRKLWERIGGFDKRFAPAYYEDTDLCFAVRQAGYHVVYCHDSEVIHHEGITAGTDIQTGYKAYQAINRYKFQAKWWEVLVNDHFPPTINPDVAAQRLTDQPPLSPLLGKEGQGVVKHRNICIPTEKIRAVHFYAQGWAAHFWDAINVDLLDTEFELIKAQGFNTLIILVPWVGFQTGIAPITYREDYFTRCHQLFATAHRYDLQIMLRIGYAHEEGMPHIPENFWRYITVGQDPIVTAAWTDFLKKLWQLVEPHPHILGGFLSWEDFFLLDLAHVSLEERLSLAVHIGYQDALCQRYSLAEIARAYQQSFDDFSAIPIPAITDKGTRLFCEFWDNWLLKLFQESAQHFPALTLEVRVDCDAEAETAICHEKTFDVSTDTHITALYYTPSWYAANQNNAESAAKALEKLHRLLATVQHQTSNALFIDQLNFIDNTPGFEKNTTILPEELPQFVTGLIPLLQQHSVGYGLWNLRDVPLNVLRNHCFIEGMTGWYLQLGEITFDNTIRQFAVHLQAHGTLSQKVESYAALPLTWLWETRRLLQLKMYGYQAAILPDSHPFTLEFKANALTTLSTKGKVSGKLTITVLKGTETIYQKTLNFESGEWQSIRIENIPFSFGYELQLQNLGEPLLLSNFNLYQWVQENGIFTQSGTPKPFYNEFIALNRQLIAFNGSVPPAFFQATAMASQWVTGIFPDQWMGKRVLGIIAAPLPNQEWHFSLQLYVPEHWQPYQNHLTLTLDDKEYRFGKTIHAGRNEFFSELSQDAFTEKFIFFKLEAEQFVTPQQYDESSTDTRQVSVQLLEFGFIFSERNQ